MIGRADIEGSKSNVAMNAWLPQASYPWGNFSDTSSLKLLKTKGSIGHAFTVCIHTENQNQVSFYPFVLHEISVLIELTLGHLRYHLTDVPPQPNSQPDGVLDEDRPVCETLVLSPERGPCGPPPLHPISKKNDKSSGISPAQQGCSHLFYTSHVFSQGQTRVKLNRVFFPRWFCKVRSLCCGFAR